MATSTAWSWSDADLLGSTRKSYAVLGQPVTPAPAGLRKVSGKRKRSTVSAVEDHPLKPSSSPFGSSTRRVRIITPAKVRPSPTPLVNEDYHVAAGFDTPDMAAAVMTMHIRDTPQLDGFRSTWNYSTPTCISRDNVAMTRECNGRPRISVEKDTSQSGWRQAAFGIFGGVAGKVFDLCYSMLPGLSAKAGQLETANEEDFDTWRRSATPLPGMYPEEEARPEVDDSPIRPAKRLHVGSGNDWVMVDTDTPETTARLSPRKVSATMTSPQSPQLSASRASSRMAPRSRKSISHPFTGSPAATASPTFVPGHRRRASLASTRSLASSRSPAARTLRSRRSMHQIGHHRSVQDLAEENERSSLSPEAQKLLERRERTERHADKSMRKMSRHIQELIRQGQQALGSDFKLEMDEGDLDEGIDIDD